MIDSKTIRKLGISEDKTSSKLAESFDLIEVEEKWDHPMERYWESFLTPWQRMLQNRFEEDDYEFVSAEHRRERGYHATGEVKNLHGKYTQEEVFR